MMLEDNIRNVPENMTMQSNPWVDLFKEHGMNVTYKISGSAADLDTKLNMAIATDDLPDIMQVTATQFQELSEAGYLADLTEVYETYATPETKAMFTQDGGIMMRNGYVDGQTRWSGHAAGISGFYPHCVDPQRLAGRMRTGCAADNGRALGDRKDVPGEEDGRNLHDRYRSDEECNGSAYADDRPAQWISCLL